MLRVYNQKQNLFIRIEIISTLRYYWELLRYYLLGRWITLDTDSSIRCKMKLEELNLHIKLILFILAVVKT